MRTSNVAALSTRRARSPSSCTVPCSSVPGSAPSVTRAAMPGRRRPTSISSTVPRNTGWSRSPSTATTVPTPKLLAGVTGSPSRTICSTWPATGARTTKSMVRPSMSTLPSRSSCSDSSADRRLRCAACSMRSRLGSPCMKRISRASTCAPLLNSCAACSPSLALSTARSAASSSRSVSDGHTSQSGSPAATFWPSWQCTLRTKPARCVLTWLSRTGSTWPVATALRTTAPRSTRSVAAPADGAHAGGSAVDARTSSGSRSRFMRESTPRGRRAPEGSRRRGARASMCPLLAAPALLLLFGLRLGRRRLRRGDRLAHVVEAADDRRDLLVDRGRAAVDLLDLVLDGVDAALIEVVLEVGAHVDDQLHPRLELRLAGVGRLLQLLELRQHGVAPVRGTLAQGRVLDAGHALLPGLAERVAVRVDVRAQGAQVVAMRDQRVDVLRERRVLGLHVAAALGRSEERRVGNE